MKLACRLALALLLAACSRSENELAQGEQPSNAVTSPTVAAAVPAYYPPGYAEMKAAATIFARENFGSPEGDVYSVEDCAEGYENAEIDDVSDAKMLNLEALARRVAKHEHYLSQLFPESVYEEPLQEYERAAIALISKMPSPPVYDDGQGFVSSQDYDKWEERDWQLKEQLAAALEQRRQRLAPAAAKVAIGGECGAGEQPYIVKTQPVDGRLWMTTKFSFDLCRARKQDPWDLTSCRWTELAPDKEAYLSGRYVYLAKWRNGAARRGVRAFDGAMNAEGPVQVVIAQP
jgi:hypothetical protein